MWTVSVLFCSLLVSFSHAVDPSPSYYLIGNSLTQDTLPQVLDGDVQWHIDCGKSLQFIHDTFEKPCVKTSTLWPVALKEKQYDFVSIQPHYGTTLAEDLDVISGWIAMQPAATIIVHTGWAFHETRATEYAEESLSEDNQMSHSPAYFDALISGLKARFPEREIRNTQAMDALAKIAKDIDSGKAPFGKMQELYRDKIHLTTDHGRYLMHNLMRKVMDQPPSDAAFPTLDPKRKVYLDSLIGDIH